VRGDSARYAPLLSPWRTSVFSRITRSLALAGLAGLLVGLTPATSQAFPTEHVEISVTLSGSGYGANVHVSGGTETEIFNVDVVRVAVAAVDLAQCIGVNDCPIAGNPTVDPTLPAIFLVHVVGGPRDLPDNVFDAYAQVTVCTADTQSACIATPVILSLG
jgi:hypothetical protein